MMAHIVLEGMAPSSDVPEKSDMSSLFGNDDETSLNSLLYGV